MYKLFLLHIYWAHCCFNLKVRLSILVKIYVSSLHFRFYLYIAPYLYTSQFISILLFRLTDWFFTILVTIDIQNTCKQRSLILSLLLCCRLLRLFITRFLYLVSLDQRILTDWLQLPQATNYIIRWHERDALILVYTLRIYPKGNSIYETNNNKAILE